MSLTPWLRVGFSAALATVSAPVLAQTKVTTSSGGSTLTAAPAAAAKPPVPAPAPAPAPVGATPAPSKNGVVLVEQAGRVAALGVVLNGDGRVLTSLSRLAPGQLFVRYDGGTLENVRIGHSDASRDLALLVPKTAKNQKGLKAAESSLPQGSSKLVAFTLGANRALSGAPQSLLGVGEMNGHTVMKLGTKPKPNELGGPLLNESGDATAILVSGCPVGPAACTADPVAMPVSEVRLFLKARPATAGYQLPRLGLVGKGADTGVVRGMLITSIEPQTPAAGAGLRGSDDPAAADVLVAVNGAPIATDDALRAVLSQHTAGDRLELLVFGKDTYRNVSVRLAAPAPIAASTPTAPAAASAPKAASPSQPPKATAVPNAPAPPKAPTGPATLPK